MSRNPSLHVVGCIAANKQKTEQSNLHKFLIAQSHNFDDESDDTEDEAKELRNENYKRVNNMIQEAKELSKKKVDHRRNPENKTKISFCKSDDTRKSCDTDTLGVLRRMERLRSNKDQRSCAREENSGKVTVCKKQDTNLEYVTGRKRSKNKVKQKKQEKTINLTDLDRNHREQQQLTGVAAVAPAPRIMSCWEQKKGSQLFESKQQSLSEYNCPGTEQELMELAIAESIKTHKAEVERHSYTMHSLIPDVRQFPEDDWDTERSKMDVMGYRHPEFYGTKNPDCQSAWGYEKNSLYLNEASAVKCGLEARTTDLKTVYFNEKPSWDEWGRRDSEKTLIDGLNDAVFDSDEESDDIPHKSDMNLELKHRPSNDETRSINGEDWDKSVGSARAVLNEMQRKSEMDLELKYRPTGVRHPPRKNKTNEVFPTMRENWACSDMRHDVELKKKNEDDIQPKSEPDFEFVSEVHVESKSVPREVETETCETKQDACLPIEQFFNFENETSPSSTEIQANKNVEVPGDAVDPDVYAMLQTLHQSMTINSAARNPEETFPFNPAVYAQQQTVNATPPQNEDLARLMAYMHIQANRNMPAAPQVLGVPFQASDRETLPVSPALEAQRQFMLNRNVADAREILPTNPSVLAFLEGQRQQSMLNMNSSEILARSISHAEPNVSESSNLQRAEGMHPGVVAAQQQLMLNALLQMQARHYAMAYPWLCSNVLLPNATVNPFVMPFANTMLGAVPPPPNTSAMRMNYGQNSIPNQVHSGAAQPPMSGLTTEALTGKGRGRIVM